MIPIERFSTARTACSKVTWRDLDELCVMHRDPRVAATIAPDGQPIPEEETRAAITRQLDH